MGAMKQNQQHTKQHGLHGEFYLDSEPLVIASSEPIPLYFFTCVHFNHIMSVCVEGPIPLLVTSSPLACHYQSMVKEEVSKKK